MRLVRVAPVAPDRMQQHDGNQDLVAGLCFVEKNDRLKIVAKSNAAPVEVENLRHRSVGIGSQGKPDARAGEILSMKTVGNFNQAPKPHSFLPYLCVGLCRLP